MKPRTSFLQKFFLGSFGVLCCVFFIEISLRIGGLVFSSLQQHRNYLSLKQKGVYRILCLGESTTANRYPSFLEKALNRRDINIKFSVIDKGVNGTNTAYILDRLESNLDAYQPDMVITMMGCNDYATMYYQDIPDSDTWLFKHCRVYRFSRIIYMHILKKLKKEDIYSVNRSILALKNSYLNQSKFFEVGTAFKKAIELNPQDDRAYLELGLLYWDQGKFSEAEAVFKKAIEFNPKNYRAHLELGRLYRDQGRFSETGAPFEKAIELNPQDDRAYLESGLLYRDQGKFSEAEVVFKEAIELNPQDDKVYFELGRLYQNQGRFFEAESPFKKVLELNPQDDRAYLELGWLYRDQGKFSEAETSFKKGLEFNPQDDRAYFELGQFYQDQGKFSEAEAVFKKAIELNPKGGKIYRALKELYKLMGNPRLAREYDKKTGELGLNYYPSMTINSYHKLKAVLDKRGIAYVCVQYPVRKLEPLKKIFQGETEGIIFVDNEKIFKEALKKSGHKEYFTDMFGGDFGHCTKKGDQLLAENIADSIFKEMLGK